MKRLKRVIKQALNLIFPGESPRTTLCESHFGCEHQGDYLALFAHFDHHGRVADYVVEYLEDLRKQGCDVILVSTSPYLSEDALQTLRSLCVRIIRRENRGLDFASWKLGYSLNQSDRRYRGVLLLNDSVLGPLSSLTPIFDEIRNESQAVLGLTDSEEIAHHIQSYFIYIPSTVFHSFTFRVFWRKIVVRTDKDLIVREYEVGLSRFLRKYGIPYRAIIPFAEVLQVATDLGDAFQYHDRIAEGRPLNPTLHMCDIIKNQFGFPFIKRELLTRNQIGSNKTEAFVDELTASPAKIAQAIVHYLHNDPV